MPSKLLEDLLLPSNAIGMIAALGVLLSFIRRRQAGKVLLVFAAVLLTVIGFLPIGKAALMVLENRFPQPLLPETVAGIVVLGGAVDTHVSADRDAVALNDAAERVTAAAILARRFPNARVFLSGGLGHLFAGHGKTESAYAHDLLAQLGVAEGRIEMEERSRNTCENAMESKAAVQPKADETWLLVTSAAHMPRAVACFKAAGFPVLPYPVDYRTRPSDLWQPSTSIAEGLAAADLAMHEWLGLAAYHFLMDTEFFPATG